MEDTFVLIFRSPPVRLRAGEPKLQIVVGVCAVRLGRDRSESVNECDNLFSICLVY